MKSYLAAAVQMTSVSDVDKNLAQAEDLIQLAVNRGAELVCLPENFSFLGDEVEKTRLSTEIAEKSEKFLITIAQRYQILLLGGGFPVPVASPSNSSPIKMYNTAVLIGREGEELARYQKMHLFDVNLPDGNNYQESATVLAGTDLPPVYHSDKYGNLGLSVCYDVRFPEIYRHLSKNGANVLFVPAAFTAFTGKDHWQVLLQARAIENTCYVIAPAQVGMHTPRRQSHGHAMIIDPWGVILDCYKVGRGVASADIDPERLQKIRNTFPVLNHQRFSCEKNATTN